MKSVLALSALLFARAVFAQDSLSTSTTPAAAATDSIVSSTGSVATTTTASSASITGSSSSASHTTTKGKSSSSSAAAAAATGASYSVPSGISSDCSAFLTALNKDTTLGTCTGSLLKATTAFGPSSSGSQSQSTLVSALDKLCSASGCPDKYVRTQLTNFASACGDELQSKNKDVLDTYDLLYIMQPFQDAICQKADDGTYCALEAPSSTSNSTSSGSTDKTGASVNAVVSGTDADAVDSAIAKFYGKSTSGSLSKRGDQSYIPDTATYRNTGVMYLYTLPTLSAASLCTDCVQKVLAAYAKWESTVPYAIGLSNSPMLGGQGEIWSVAKAKCGNSFLNTVTASAGTDNAETNAGSQVGVSGAVAGAFAVAMGFWVAL